jgi:hypothetical protein
MEVGKQKGIVGFTCRMHGTDEGCNREKGKGGSILGGGRPRYEQPLQVGLKIIIMVRVDSINLAQDN